MSRRPQLLCPPHRRGSLYISVLAVATIVSVIAISSLHLARLHLAGAVADNDRYSARLLAVSAIEHAIAEFNTNPNWTTDYVADTEYPLTPPVVNGGTFVWKWIDQGNQQRQIVGIGRVGDASCAMQVDLGKPAEWFDYGMICGGDVTVGPNNKASDFRVDGAPVCSNSTFTHSTGTTTADVEAQVINGTINGTATAPAAIRAMPTSQNVLNYYTVNGTPLGANQIQRQLISPYSNPYGATNPDGIYVIDGNGSSVAIRESRIVGTLVVVNASYVEITEQVNWEPAHPNFPALIVQGDIHFRPIDGTLRESEEGINFNPPQTPYMSATDSTLDDSYPSAIAGIVYCTGNMAIDGNNNGFSAAFHGVLVVAGSCVIEREAGAYIEYDPAARDAPPPGFDSTPSNQIRRGSWRQIPSS